MIDPTVIADAFVRERDALDAARYRQLRAGPKLDPDVYPSSPWVVRVVLQPLPSLAPIFGRELDAVLDALAGRPEEPTP